MKKDIVQNINSSVMEQIKNQKITMKPKIYFIAISAISIIITILSGITVSYISSILFLWIKILNSNNMAWGARSKLENLLISFPWYILIISAILITLAVYLIKKQNHMYKYKSSTIAVIVIVTSIFLGLVFSSFGIADNSHLIKSINNKNQFQHQFKNK